MQVIKALLTAVTSPSTAVHGNSLLEAVRACYHIFLVSNNVVNRTTARASLQQMLDFVFRQMQAVDSQLAEAEAKRVQATASPPRPPASASLPVDGDDTAAAEEGHSASEEASASPDAPSASASASPSASPSASVAGTACSGTMYASVASQLGFAAEGTASGGAAAGAGAGAGAGTDAGAAPAAAAPPQVPATPSSSSKAFRSPVHRDAFLLFRALYRLSMKQESEGGAPAGSVAMRSKVCGSPTFWGA